MDKEVAAKYLGISIRSLERYMAQGRVAAEGRRVAVNDLVLRYNQIVEEVETDPSLKIELK